MSKLSAFTLVLIVLASGFFYSNAQASTVSECQALINQITSDLAVVTIGGKNAERTRASLESKLEGASTKLDEGKFQDAFDKMVDFRTGVEKLVSAAKPKISQADADLLIADADNVLACIQSLIDGS